MGRRKTRPQQPAPAKEPSARRGDLLPVLGLLLLTLVFFAPVLFAGKVFWPADMLPRMQPWRGVPEFVHAGRPYNPMLDPIQQFYPWRSYAAQSLRSGEVPLWNPYTFSGSPFLANGQSALLYPLNVIFLILGAERGAGWAAALHLFLCALFTFLWLRRHVSHPVAAAIGGVTFSLSGFFVGWMQFPTFASVGVWLPAALWAWDNAAESRASSLRWAVLTGLFLGVQFLGGHLQISSYVVVAFVIYGLFHVVSGSSRTERPRLAGLLVGCLALALMVGAGQILPSLEYGKYNFPKGGAFSDVRTNSLKPVELLLQFVPNLFGNPVDYNYWGSQAFSEVCSYAGIAALLLAAIGIAASRSPLRWFLGGIALLGLLWSMGTAVAQAFYYLLPGFRHIAGLPRAMYLWDFGVAGLAALGAGVLLSLRGNVRRRTITAVVATGTVGAMVFVGGLEFIGTSLKVSGLPLDQESELWTYTWREGERFLALLILSAAGSLAALLRHGLWRTVGMATIIAVLAVDLFTFGRRFQPMVDGQILRETPPSVQYLRANLGSGRLVSVGADFLNRMPPNLPLRFGLRDIYGSDSFCPKPYWEVLTRLGEPTQGARSLCLGSPVADFLGLTYVLSGEPLDGVPGLGFVGHSDAYLYKRLTARPRVTVVVRTRVARTEEEALDLLLGGADLGQEVILQGAAETRAAASEAGAASLVSDGENLLRIHVAAREDGYLVVADTFFPGWRAYRDDTETEVLQANYAFRAVPAPVGDYDVWMAYEPASVRTGLFFLMLGLAMAAGILSMRRSGLRSAS